MDEEPPRRLRRWVREEICCGSSGSRSLRRDLENFVLSEDVEKGSEVGGGSVETCKVSSQHLHLDAVVSGALDRC
jgi:hypothetical protein